MSAIRPISQTLRMRQQDFGRYRSLWSKLLSLYRKVRRHNLFESSIAILTCGHVIGTCGCILVEYLGEIMDLCFSHRSVELDYRYLESSGASSSRAMLTCIMPLSEIVTDFFDKLKSRSSGFASFE